MSIQIDDGEFTRLHNTIFEKLAVARLTASEYRCLFFLFRMTYGWQKKEDAISLSQWATGTGIDPEKKRHNVLRTLQGLVAKRVIYTKSNGNNHPATWGFNKHFDEWDAAIFDDAVISPDNSHETVISPDNTTVIAADNTTVISPDNKTVISPDNHKRKKESLKKDKEREKPARAPAPSTALLPAAKVLNHKSPYLVPGRFVDNRIPAGTGINAVEIYYERFSINQDGARLSAIKEDDLIACCKDLDKLREVVTAYSQTTYQPGNVKLILDWYQDGIPNKRAASGAETPKKGIEAFWQVARAQGANI